MNHNSIIGIGVSIVLIVYIIMFSAVIYSIHLPSPIMMVGIIIGLLSLIVWVIQRHTESKGVSYGIGGIAMLIMIGYLFFNYTAVMPQAVGLEVSLTALFGLILSESITSLSSSNDESAVLEIPHDVKLSYDEFCCMVSIIHKSDISQYSHNLLIELVFDLYYANNPIKKLRLKNALRLIKIVINRSNGKFADLAGVIEYLTKLTKHNNIQTKQLGYL